MHRHLLILSALTAFWAFPVSAHGDGAPDARSHASPCKAARADEHAQAPAAKPSAAQASTSDAPTGGFLSRGWLSFFSRSSSPLLP